MESVTIESINYLVEEMNIRLETVEENIRFLMNSNEVSAGSNMSIQPVVSTAQMIKITVEHFGITYQFNVPKFKLPGSPEEYLAAEAAAVPELIERILSINGQNILTEIV